MPTEILQDSQSDFSPDKLKEVFVAFHAYAIQFTQNVNQKYPYITSTIDPVFTLNVVSSAYDDIKRYKLYHQDDFYLDKSDAVKRAAYFTKWILKLRPIMITHTPEYESVADEDKDRSLFLNELLALSWGLDNLADELGIQGLRLKPKSFANAIYDFHFREINGDGLIAMFMFYSDIAKNPADRIIERSVI